MIEEIITLLSDNQASLEAALLKTKVIAKRLGNANLEIWASNELNGYSPHGDVPEYRKAKTTPMCDLVVSEWQIEQNMPVPLSLLSKTYADFLISFKLTDAIAGLEQIAKSEKEYIGKPLGVEFAAALSRDLRDKGYQFSINNPRQLVLLTEIHNSLGKIRHKLLDFMLELEKQYPHFDDDLKKGALDKTQVNQKIVTIMSQINITTTGSGNVITTGSGNTITVNTKIQQGDIDGLIAVLKQLKVEESDVDEITTIVSEETPDLESKTFGERAIGWVSKMVSKSLHGTWDIASGTAAGVLTELLQNYYGF